MKLFIRVKFRAFGITFGQVEQEVDISAFVEAVVRRQVERVNKDLAGLVSRDTVHLSAQGVLGGRPLVLFNDRGIYVEVR